MNIPKNYHVLFLAGGASTQFAMVPLNLFQNKASADYLDTGIWSKKAIAEAERYGKVNIAAQTKLSAAGKFLIPAPKEWSLDPAAAFVHYTPNETIEGIQFPFVPQTKTVPLVADMTSFILSEEVNVHDFALIYAGVQKNLGQAGMTVVIIRDDLIMDAPARTPTLYSYKVQAESHSFYNTPPTYCWYILGLMLEWMKSKGGVRFFAEQNQRKAKKLYAAIDHSAGFYFNSVEQEYRSVMNIPFNLKNTELTPVFLDEAKKAGLVHLKGHRLSGGVRASIYNAMAEEGVDRLVDFMSEFAKKNQ